VEFPFVSLATDSDREGVPTKEVAQRLKYLQRHREFLTIEDGFVLTLENSHCLISDCAERPLGQRSALDGVLTGKGASKACAVM
jgi:hypothetical protein